MKRFSIVRSTTLSIALFTILAADFTSVSAEEPHQQFLNAMRSNGYHDYALFYIDTLAKRPGTPQDLRDRFDFERAETIIMQSNSMTNPDTKNAKLKQAETYLQKFLREHPTHTYAGQAQSKQGSIYLNRARVLNYQLNSPAIAKNKLKQVDLRKQSRAEINRAKAIFEKARIHFEKETKKYKVYIPPEQKNLITARDLATASFVSAQFHAALCLYEEAQTYKGTELKKRLLIASKAFEPVHSKYRDWGGGLHARLRQGKCYEEMGSNTDIRRALGIYNELLRHPGTSPIMMQVKNSALHYRLICLNHSSRKDYELVISESNQWLAKNRNLSLVSLGIQWEKAIAEESLGKARDLTENERKKFLQDAFDDAEKINRFGGEYKDISTAMIQRIKSQLGLKDTIPKDFESAFAQAEMKVSKIGTLQDAISKEKDKKRKELLEADLTTLKREAKKKLLVAMSLANNRTTAKQKHRARSMLGYVSYLLKEYYEASVYAGFVADNGRKIDEEVAMQASVIAYYSWTEAYFAVPDDQSKEFETSMLIKALERTIKYWPKSKDAADAMMNLGILYNGMDKHALAAEQFKRVPSSSSKYKEAQFEAGKTFLAAHAQVSKWSEKEHPDKQAKMKQYEAAAEKHFRTAITLFNKENPPKQPIMPQLADAKTNLASILKYRSKFRESIQVLTSEPHSIVREIQVKNEKTRPETGVKSKEFATNVYQMLLFSYIGVSEVKKATEALEALEKIGGKADTGYYVSLGRKLSNDLERLKKEGKTTELKKVRSSFESFLDTLSAKKTGQTYQSLIWVAETYNSLGGGSKEDLSASRIYFKKAAVSYKQIIDRAEKDDKFIDAQRLKLVKLRLVNCWSEEGQYQKSFDLASSIIKATPKNLQAQQEMARLLQAWGANKEPAKLLESIHGNQRNKTPGLIWGWGQIARRLQQNLSMISSNTKTGKDYREKWIDASYQSSWCRLEYAKSLSGSNQKKSKQQSNAAMSEIRSFVSLAGEIDSESWDKFDNLYQAAQNAKGVSPVVPLKKPKKYSVVSNPLPVEGTENNSSKKPKKTNQAKKPKEDISMVWVIAGLVIAVAIAGGLVFLMMFKSSKPTYSRPTYADDAPDLNAIEDARIQAEKKREETRRRAAMAMKKQRASSATATKRRSAQSTKPKTSSSSSASRSAKPKSQAERPKRRRKKETE